jgi:hypothetical protein
MSSLYYAELIISAKVTQRRIVVDRAVFYHVMRWNSILFRHTDFMRFRYHTAAFPKLFSSGDHFY